MPIWNIPARMLDHLRSRVMEETVAFMAAAFDRAKSELRKEYEEKLKAYRREKEDEMRVTRTNSNEFIAKVVELERAIDVVNRERKVQKLVITDLCARLVELQGDYFEQHPSREELMEDAWEIVGKPHVPVSKLYLEDAAQVEDVPHDLLHDLLTDISGPSPSE